MATKIISEKVYAMDVWLIRIKTLRDAPLYSVVSGLEQEYQHNLDLAIACCREGIRRCESFVSYGCHALAALEQLSTQKEILLYLDCAAACYDATASM